MTDSTGQLVDYATPKVEGRQKSEVTANLSLKKRLCDLFNQAIWTDTAISTFAPFFSFFASILQYPHFLWPPPTLQSQPFPDLHQLGNFLLVNLLISACSILSLSLSAFPPISSTFSLTPTKVRSLHLFPDLHQFRNLTFSSPPVMIIFIISGSA